MNDGLTSSEEAKKYFDTIDRVHEILENAKDLVKEVPSCVVVGMQSAGKSSVLSRISGIPFPQDSEVCTRVAIELRLRRSTSFENNQTLQIKAGETSEFKVDKDDKGAIERALVQAQQDVLGGKPFEDKLSVKVEKEDKDIPDVTLIDLPGVFFAKSEQEELLELQIQNMIKDRVQNNMTVILHIVPLNQDTDTISTWRTVLEADPEQERSICILTKADLALRDGKDVLKRRLQKICSELKHHKCFVVQGRLKDNQDEIFALKDVQHCILEMGLDHLFAVGIPALNECIEEKMLQHIKATLPDLRRSLNEKYKSYKEELSTIGVRNKSSHEIALSYRDSVMDHIEGQSDSCQVKYRNLVDKFSNDTFNISMRVLRGVTYFVPKNTPESISKTTTFQLAKQIESIGDHNRGFVNSCFSGHDKALRMFVEQFVESFDKITSKFIHDLYAAFITDVLNPSFDKVRHDFKMKKVFGSAEKAIKDVVMVEHEKALKDKDRIMHCCSRNLLTTNLHYLEDSSAELYTHYMKYCESWTCLEDLKPALKKLSDIQGFIKVRKKTLADDIQMQCIVSLQDLPEVIKQTLKNVLFCDEALALIKEPPQLVAKRTFYSERLEILKKALDEMRFM
jgi:GTPase SAR1 family protein